MNYNITYDTNSYRDLIEFHDFLRFPEAEALVPINVRD